MAVVDAPAFRIWPPVALGVPLATGLLLTATAGDPVSIAGSATRWVGWALVVAFVLWNGWTLAYMATHNTAVLPGGATVLVLQSGPFRLSRNPLYVGLVALDVGWALRRALVLGAGAGAGRRRCPLVGRDPARGALPGNQVRRRLRRLPGPGAAVALTCQTDRNHP